MIIITHTNQVFDWDQLGKDDALGRFSFSVTEAVAMNSPGDITPRWFKLYDWDNVQIPGADILMSFQLLEGIQAGIPLPDLAPPTVPMILDVVTLGCRNLSR